MHGPSGSSFPCLPEPYLYFLSCFSSQRFVSAPSRTDSMSHFPSVFTPTDFLKELLDTCSPLILHSIKPLLSSASLNRPGLARSWRKKKLISLPLTSLPIHPHISEQLSGVVGFSLWFVDFLRFSLGGSLKSFQVIFSSTPSESSCSGVCLWLDRNMKQPQFACLLSFRDIGKVFSALPKA